MNEKFNQLLQAATAAVDSTIPEDKWHTYVHDNAIQAKFAELIVMECCNFFVELRTRPADLAVKDVKRHFGVEE